MYGLINISLRLLNILLKSVLMLVIADILPTYELGIYGALLAFITLTIYFLGWEIWYIYNREITKVYGKNISKSIVVLGNQFVSYLVIYFIILPIVIYYLFYKYDLYWQHVVIIIVSFHISAEIARIYTHISKHLLASMTAILVQSSWIIVVLYNYYNKTNLDLYMIIRINAFYSFIFLILTIIVFLFTIKIKPNYFNYFFIQINFGKIILNIKKSSKFLISVLSFMLGILIGRFYLEGFGYIEENAIFSYFQNISSVSLILLNFGLTVIMIPKLIQNRSNTFEHIAMLKIFFRKTILHSALIFILINISAFFYIKYIIINNVFIENILLFFCINFGYFLINLGSYYNSVLYVWDGDRQVVLSNACSFLIMLPFFILIFISEEPIWIVIFVFIFWASLNLLLKRWYAKKVLYDIDR